MTEELDTQLETGGSTKRADAHLHSQETSERGELKGELKTAQRLRNYGMNLEQIQAMTALTDEQMKTL